MSVYWQSPGGTWGHWITGVQFPHGLLKAYHLISQNLIKKILTNINDFTLLRCWLLFNSFTVALVPVPYVLNILMTYLWKSSQWVSLRSSSRLLGCRWSRSWFRWCLIYSLNLTFLPGIPVLFMVVCPVFMLDIPRSWTILSCTKIVVDIKCPCGSRICPVDLSCIRLRGIHLLTVSVFNSIVAPE